MCLQSSTIQYFFKRYGCVLAYLFIFNFEALSSVAVIKEPSADPLFKAKLACFALIAKATEGFLTQYQLPALLSHSCMTI